MKILVIQMKMIGDVLTSSILFEALRKKYPQARLDYLVYKHTHPVIENNPNIDKLILFQPEKHSSLSGLKKIAQKVRNENYDIVIDVYSKINSAWITSCSGAKTKISYRKWYTKFLYTHTFPYKSKAETRAGLAVENRMQLLKAIDPDFPIEIKPKIYLTEDEKDKAQQLLESAGLDDGKPLFMIGILGSGPEKTYPDAYMAKVIDHVAKEVPSNLLINYIPEQKDRVIEIMKLCAPETRKKIHPEIFGKSLREFIILCSRCDALIGNEGGAVNIAKALNVPSFSIFAPQTPKKDWGIYEDDLNNFSVHLRDYREDLYENLDKKQLRKVSEGLYQIFKPELFLDKLNIFLKKFK